MSRHEGVSCDSCNIGNFRGRRFKCLICYDYDLCATCYENGATTTRHTADHPMQCILTRTDFELYYGGEAFTADQPQSFTCPYCGKMGFTESALQEHVASEHSDASIEVVCPVCAALPGGDPNHVTDDFAAHLTLEHRAPSRPDILYDEPPPVRHVRRLFHPAVSGSRPRPPRPRAANMHFGGSGNSALASSSSSSSTSARESMDPIAELLSQLSGVRRAAQQPQPPMQSQLQLLQQQLQLERQQVQQTRERLERLPARRQMAAAAAAAAAAGSSVTATSTVSAQESSSSASSSFLLSRANEPALSESEQEALERERADRSLFVQDLILSTLGSAAFRRRVRSRVSVADASNEFSRITLQDSERIQAIGNETRSESQDLNVVEQDITVQDMELISLETDEDEDKDS